VSQTPRPAPGGTEKPLVPWMLSFVRPYRGRVSLLGVLLLLEIGLGALEPWPLKIVIDNVLDQRALPEPLRQWLPTVAADDRVRITLLVVIVIAGLLLQLANQFVTAHAIQLQGATGQRMVYDLRYRLFRHMQGLGLHHHIMTSTGDAVYRVDNDAYSIENLVMSGLLPLPRR